MTVQKQLLAVCILLCSQQAGLCKGSSVIKDEPWNSDRVDHLPSEIRQYIARICKGAPAARHDFATYSPPEKRRRINLEYLRCNGLGEYRYGNQCLDVDFVEIKSHFKLSSKHYAPCGF